MTGNLRAIGKFQIPVGALNTNANGFLRREDLHAKAPRLRNSTTRQVKAGEPGRKAEIILNPRTKSGLASRRFALDDHRAQALARAIHSRGKSRGTAANDSEIIEIRLGMHAKADFICDGRQRRLREACSIREKD